MKTSYYLNNKNYSLFLNQGPPETFEVYTDLIKSSVSSNDKFLDVGCGTGTVVSTLARQGYNAYGVEISNTSLQIAKKKQGHFKLYDGTVLPFQDESFSAVGNIDVIEHVENVETFLLECLRVLKRGGYLIICAPNFLSLTSSYHHRNAGFQRKIFNFIEVLWKLINFFNHKQVKFKKFAPVIRNNFQPDDDATNLINPLDLLKWGKERKLTTISYSGSFMPRSYLSYHLGRIPILNLVTGGISVVFKK